MNGLENGALSPSPARWRMLRFPSTGVIVSAGSDEPRFPRPPEDDLAYLGAIADECRMGADFPRSRPKFRCPYRDHTVAVLSVVIRESANEEVARHFEAKKIVHRCGTVASVLLGQETGLSPELEHLKRRYHELMTLEMTLQTALDDLVDEARVGPDDVDVLLSMFTSALAGSCEAPSEPTSNTATMDVCKAIATMQQRRNRLLHELDIRMEPGSVTTVLQERFIATYRQVRRRFTMFSDYRKHRSDNCGMPIQAYWAAHWHCRRRGMDPLVYEEHPRHTCTFLRWYACLGGISNDLVGYDKDISEGVTTSVSVLTRELGCNTTDAFHAAIAFHNDRLMELLVALRARHHHDHHYVLLFSALLSAWSIHVLHLEYSHRYDMVALRAALRASYM